MKKYLILIVAMLFATLTVTTAQRKIVTDKLQLTGLKNAETIGFDAKGNAVAKTFPKVDLTPIQAELATKLDAGTYKGSADDLLDRISNFVPYTGAARNIQLDKDIKLTYGRDRNLDISALNGITYNAEYSSGEVYGSNLSYYYGLSVYHKDKDGKITNKLSLENNRVSLSDKNNNEATLHSSSLYFRKKKNDKYYSTYIRQNSYLDDNIAIQLPKKSGILALAEDVPSSSNFVPYTGATKDIQLDKDIKLTYGRDRNLDISALNGITYNAEYSSGEVYGSNLSYYYGLSVYHKDKDGKITNKLSLENNRVSLSDTEGVESSLSSTGLFFKNKNNDKYYSTSISRNSNLEDNVNIQLPKKSGVLATLDDITQADFIGLKPTTSPVAPKAGMVYYDKTSNKLRCYNGTEWKDLF